MPDPIVLKGAARPTSAVAASTTRTSVLVREDLGLYVVADGAGGHNSGEVASALAVRSMENYFGATIRNTHDLPEFDSWASRTARAVCPRRCTRPTATSWTCPRRARAQGHGHHGGGAGFSPRSGLMHVAHVGDSRCYRMRGGHLELLTQDHSLFTDVIEQRPELDDTVLERLPKNVVTRALGIDLRAPRVAALVRGGARVIATCSAPTA